MGVDQTRSETAFFETLSAWAHPRVRVAPEVVVPKRPDHAVAMGLVRVSGEASSLLSLFATPLLVTRIGIDVCAAAAGALVEQARTTASVARGVVGGWHGPPDLPARLDPPWPELTQAVADAVRQAHHAQRATIDDHPPAEPLALEGWGTVLGHGDYVVSHDHAGALWSAVCYLDAGDPAPTDRPDAGCLVLVDPRGSAATTDLFPRHCTLTPETGLLIVFPAWLTHFVHPYEGTRLRVAAAYNAVVSPS